MASIIALTVTMTSSLIVQMIMITVIVKASKSRRRDAEPVTPVGHPLPARPGFKGPERSTGHLFDNEPCNVPVRVHCACSSTLDARPLLPLALPSPLCPKSKSS